MRPFASAKGIFKDERLKPIIRSHRLVLLFGIEQNHMFCVYNSMVRKSVSIILMVLILLPIFGKSWILISFKFNQESIAKNLCVLRNVKNNSCHGCCQLKKRLAEKDKQEQKQLPRGSTEKNNPFSDYFFEESDNLFYHSSSEKDPFKNNDSSLLNISLEALFRPPQV